MIVMLMTEDEVASFRGRGGGEAGFGALTCERGALPLTAMDVHARVVGVLAAVEVAQTFVNTTGTPIEATYIFPLPDRAAVNRFRMEVNGRVVEGVVDERGAARQQYDQAIAAGHRAAITEEERAGVFTLRVGNLMPGEIATIRLSLVGPLPVDDGEVTFRFPLVVAPRYIPGAQLGGEQAGLGSARDTDLVPDASRISPPVRLPGWHSPVRLGIRVAIEDHFVGDVASSLHAITVAHRDAKVIEVQPGERLDRDFILRWRADGAQLRSTLTCTDDPDGRGGTFLLTMVPPSTTAMASRPRDVVFVIDRSGSMGGWKMVAARRAAARMIDTLTSRDRFCAIAFDNVAEMLPDAGLVEASDRNRYRAVEALAKVDARGGTEMMQPLSRAVQMLAGGHDDRERVVVLVTDGQVGNEDHIVRELAPHMRNVRMFALGIDQAVNAAFLRRLASAGGGLCELVESEDRLDVVMAKVHRRIGTPVVTNLGVRAVGLEVDATSIAPAKLPDVYAGAPVTILGRYRGQATASAAIELDGTSFGDAMHERIGRTYGEGAAPSTWLAASWARAHIRDLEDRYASGAHDLEGRIVSVSKQFGVLSRFTAYLAVDRASIANPGGMLRQVVQPVEKPAGWDGAAHGMGGQTRAGGVAPQGYAQRVPRPSEAAPTLSRAVAPRQAPAPAPMGMPMSPPAMGGAPGSAPPSGPPPQNFKTMMVPPSASPMPPPPPASYQQEREKDSADDKREESRGAPSNGYLTKLAELARMLEQRAGGDVRIVRQRLVEWVEDLRSVGGDAALGASVELLVQRLVAGASADEVRAVATELHRLAAGGAPTTPPKASGRSFWK